MDLTFLYRCQWQPTNGTGHSGPWLAAGYLFAHAGQQAQLDALGLLVHGHWSAWQAQPNQNRQRNHLHQLGVYLVPDLVGIRHQRIKTCAPWQNGRIERLFGTLKPLLRQLVIPTKAALQSALEEFTLFYNHARPHQNLDGLTPAEKWNGLSRADLMQTPPKRAVLVTALDGLLVGYCMRR